MRQYLWLALAACLLHTGLPLGVDMGSCGCMCGIGGPNTGSVIGPGGSLTDASSFLNRVRGQKGDIGRPGKAGPAGGVGPPGMRGQRGIPGPAGGGGGDEAAFPSCFDLRGASYTTSGIYKIKPSALSSSFYTYCDMETAGGGWTLVASIHENNIQGKCTIGDNWSSDQGSAPSNYTGSKNWENFNVFGNVESATDADYKNQAYAALPASDVMIWHVPNGADVSQWSSLAFLKYYTDNGFLTDNGGNLQSMYSKYFPLKRVSNAGTAQEGVVSILRALNASASAVRSSIPNWYSYTYDFTSGATQNYISDGGGDMYDTGNKVYYKIGTGSFQQITYNKVYRDLVNGIEVSSSTEHPFVMLMWIGNRGGAIESFRIKVQSGTGADGSGSHASYRGEISYEGLMAKYKAYNVYDANDPSICEVYFYVANQNTWGSVLPSNFDSVDWSTGTDSLVNSVRASGSPQNILMGYTLLSREDDYQVEESHVRRALEHMLQDIAHFNQIENFNCSRVNESLVTPVRYLLGDNDAVMARVPPNIRSQVQPGYIHFRAYSPKGIPNALCPGVKSDACSPASVCVGGINTYNSDRQSCGDFAGWAGNSGNQPTKTEPDGMAHSLDDIDSSILIFTRKQTTGKVVTKPRKT